MGIGARYGSTRWFHLVGSAFQRAFIDRNTKLGDPDFVKLPVERLLSDAWAKEQRAGIATDRPTPSRAIAVAGPAIGPGANPPPCPVQVETPLDFPGLWPQLEEVLVALLPVTRLDVVDGEIDGPADRHDPGHTPDDGQ